MSLVCEGYDTVLMHFLECCYSAVWSIRCINDILWSAHYIIWKGNRKIQAQERTL